MERRQSRQKKGLDPCEEENAGDHKKLRKEIKVLLIKGGVVERQYKKHGECISFSKSYDD